ncbi:MAG TPA: hypothetical protein VD865_16815 [Stenotrophomonas sp.]|nr:hypothetical protein [Stenotrophomonas sp.]
MPFKPFAFVLAALALAGSHHAHAQTQAAPEAPTAAAQQVVVVVTEGWDANQGRLQAFARTASGWTPSGPGFAVAIGRNGSAWGSGLTTVEGEPRKREGDGRSPAGVFAIGPAFGYAAHIDSTMPYQQMQADSWCIDVPASPLYNRIVNAREVGAEAVKGSSEAMRLDLHHDGDPRYREGFVIAHNPGNVPQAGSCIFAHLWRQPGETTAGCTAMAAADMQRLLRWLQPHQQPKFVLLPRAEYTRLQAAWQLPALAQAAAP